MHHEAEMLVALKSGATDILLNDALNHVFGYDLSPDMTRRDLQGIQKKMGRPWGIGKAFERSAPCGTIHPVSEVGRPDQGSLMLTVIGASRQEADLNQMIWKVPEMVSYLSKYFELAAGDVTMTGTPSGVAAVEEGDVMVLTINGLGSLEVTVT